jgi:hypothetical protein
VRQSVLGTFGGGVDVASLDLLPTSSLDRAQLSWSGISRPLPPLGLTFLQAPPESDGKAFVAIELPFAAMGSSDEANWQTTIQELLSALATASHGEAARLEPTAASPNDATVADEARPARRTLPPAGYAAVVGLTLAAIALLERSVWRFGNSSAVGPAP